LVSARAVHPHEANAESLRHPIAVISVSEILSVIRGAASAALI